MHWSELNYYGEYEYLPHWSGFILACIGAVAAVLTIILGFSLMYTRGTISGMSVTFIGLVISASLMFIGLFMDDTGFLLDTSWREKYDLDQ